MALPAKKLSNYFFPLGTNIDAGTIVHLCAQWLATGIHIIGPPGVGKTMLLFWLFQVCTKIRNATIVLFDPKGDLFYLARDWAIARGLVDRLDIFDLSDPEYCMQFSNLRPNGLEIASQTKFAREAFRSAWGQASFDLTPQLARLLFMVLFVARTLEWTLLEAVELLRPGSNTRKQALAKLPPSYVRDALVYFDSLSERRQEELSASCLARIEPFIADPQIQRVIAPRGKYSFDVEQQIRCHGIWLIDLQLYYPLLPDDQRLLARLFLNDILAHGLGRPKHLRDPIILIGDEIEEYATHDLCRALDMGRGQGVYSILAHQHISQVMDEDKSGYLFSSLMNSARTKIIFGGNSVRDLEEHLVKEVLIDQYDPWTIKDELTSLELDPVEEARVSTTVGESHSHARGLAFPYSESEGEAETEADSVSFGESVGRTRSTSRASTQGRSRGWSESFGTADTQSTHWSETESETASWSQTEGEGRAALSSSGGSSGSGSSGARERGVSWDPDGGITWSSHQAQGWDATQNATASTGKSVSSFSSSGRGGSIAHASSVGGSVSHTDSHAVGIQKSESDSDTVGETSGVSRGVSFTKSSSIGTTRSATIIRGRTPSISEEESVSQSTTTSPFYAYQKRHVVSSRTFLTKEEFLTLGLQRIKGQPRGHFLIKVPGKRAVFVRAPFIKEPRITAQQLAQARERIFAQPYYTRVITAHDGDKISPSVLQLPEKEEDHVAPTPHDPISKHQPQEPEPGSRGTSRPFEFPIPAKRGNKNPPRPRPRTRKV
jgi:hypothetical protein